MDIDAGLAFTFMFDDPDWLKKIAIGGGIMFVGLILSPILIGLALFLPINGYMLETLKNVRDNRPTPLPEWTDFGVLFSKGLIVFVIGLIYSLPAILIACPIFAVWVAIPMFDLDPDQSSQVAIASFLCLVCAIVLVIFIVAVLFPIALIRYAQDETFSSAFQFREMFQFISKNPGDYIVVILLIFVAQFVAQFGVILCGVGVLFTGFWATLVTANLYGQLARKASGMSPISM